MDLIEKITDIARREYNGDFSKAATAYFHDRPEEWQAHMEKVTEVKKQAGEDPKYVNGEVQYRTQMVAHRDKLDLNKAADVVAAQKKVFTEDRDLYSRFTAAHTVYVGARVRD